RTDLSFLSTADRACLRRTSPAAVLPVRVVACELRGSRQDAELVERVAQLVGVAIDPKSSGSSQLVLAVAAAQQADAEHSGPTRGQQIPDGVADHITLGGLNAETLCAGQEEIRLRLRALDVAARDHDGLRGHL